MKTLIPVLLVLCLCASFIKPAKDKHGSLKLEVTKKGWIKDHDEDYLAIKVSIRNTTDDTVSFINYTCSYYDVFTLNNKDVVFQEWGCDRNVPANFAIPPRKAYDYNMAVRCTRKSDACKFKLGFMWFPVSVSTSLGTVWNNKGKPYETIWSDELTIR